MGFFFLFLVCGFVFLPLQDYSQSRLECLVSPVSVPSTPTRPLTSQARSGPRAHCALEQGCSNFSTHDTFCPENATRGRDASSALATCSSEAVTQFKKLGRLGRHSSIGAPRLPLGSFTRIFQGKRTSFETRVIAQWGGYLRCM